jgi:hypothetical protein
MKAFIHGINVAHPDSFELENVTSLNARSFYSGSLTLDPSSPYFPVRSDQKIMRSDTKMAVMLVQEMLADKNINLSETGLFVASGAFIEDLNKHLGHLIRVFENIKASETEAEKLRNIFKASPPLLALQTLTNGTMSFIAQYTGIKGNNATFGTTSLSGIQAIEEACFVSEYENNAAVAVASNVGGEFSFMSNVTLSDEQEKWKESAAAATVLIGPEKEDSVCKISAINYSEKLQSLNEKSKTNNWSELLIDDKAEVIIHSGAYTTSQNNKDVAYCQELDASTVCEFEKLGNLGTANVFSSIMKGIELLQRGAKTIDILDRDIYGRAGMIRIERNGK